MNDVRIYATALTDSDVLDLSSSRFSLDQVGNFFCNTLDANSKALDTNSIPYERMIEDTNIEGQSWYDYYGTDSYINNRIYYGSQTEYSAEIEVALNPVGELDLMTKVIIDTTHYVRYRQLSVNYYFVPDPTKTYRVSQ